MESSLLSHSFVTYAFDAYPRNRCKVPCQEDLLPFPSQSFAALPHVVGSLARCDPFPSQSFAALPHVVGSLARCDPAL